MKWFETSWEHLTPNQVHAMIRLRLDVFVVEQDCVYADLDGKDLDSIHLWSERSDAGPVKLRNLLCACCLRAYRMTCRVLVVWHAKTPSVEPVWDKS